MVSSLANHSYLAVKTTCRSSMFFSHTRATQAVLTLPRWSRRASSNIASSPTISPATCHHPDTTDSANDGLDNRSPTRTPPSTNNTQSPVHLEHPPQAKEFQLLSSRAPHGHQLTGAGRGPRGLMQPTSVLYIGNIHFEVDEEQLRKHLAGPNGPAKVSLLRDGRKLSKGYGFAHFDNAKLAGFARNRIDGTIIRGRALKAEFAYGKSQRETAIEQPPSRTLVIQNMSLSMTDRDINDLFRQVKNAVDIRIATDRRTGQPKGFVFADFLHAADAAAAMAFLQGQEFYGRRLVVGYGEVSSLGEV